ncbi:MAG TPA: NAD(P)-binding domain-containing protein [Pseudobdellovibrionaceae bacterium]|jgi:thioredoxin reductase/NAD-dependent dihydropyrimidine dehydrogenase PreA subunit
MGFLNFIADNVVLTFIVLVGFYSMLSILRREKHHREAKNLLSKAVKSGLNEPMSLHPEIDSGLCAGCGACTTICPEGDIIKLINHKAVLVGPTKCVGHGECEKACPLNAIKLVFGTKTRGMDIPRLNSNYETNVPGLYIAGELGGMGLIRNAIKQGILATTDAVKKLPQENAEYDVIIVGGGPAGLASGVTAIAEKKSYLLLEQNSFGGTVYNFPRQKIVMSHPFELPLIGKFKFESNRISKEQLLKYWNNVRKKTGLKVQVDTKFEGLEKTGNIFKVKSSKGEYTARKVILCMGVRGSPRRLGVPGEDLPKVTYNLLDPEQYQGKKVIVVGGGNAAVEAAQMLSEKRWRNEVHLLVRGPTFDRCNEDNMKRILEMESKGLLSIWYNSSVQAIALGLTKIKKQEEIIDLRNDFVFIFAGAELPHKFLMGLGVEIDKKFGEGMKNAI